MFSAGVVCCVHTDTQSRSAGEAGAVVALQPSLGVAGQALAAGLALLPGTHLATPTGVGHQRNANGAAWRGGGALACSTARLAAHLSENQHG